jgi:hypothetical protein
MPNIVKLLRDYQQLKLEIDAEIHRLQLPPGTTAEQLAGLVTTAYEDGFTTGMNRKRGRKPGIKSKPPKSKPPAKKKKKRKLNPKLAALNLHRKVRRQIIETLGDRSLSRGQLVEQTGLDAETIHTCVQKEKGRWFITTPGYRWRVNPKHQASEEKLRKTRQKARKAVADGARPSFKRVIAKIMGKRTMGPKGVLDALKAGDPADIPESKNLLNYVNYTLCQYPETFERVGRGQYQVK